VTYMSCPRCGLTVQARASYLIVDRYPRCVARRRQLVHMQIIDPPDRGAETPRPAKSVRSLRRADEDERGEVPLAG
jgi:hypothetical protein